MRFKTAISCILLTCGSSALAAVDCSLKENISASQARAGLCGFSAEARAFEGTPAQQAECLTRAVQYRGEIGGPTLTPYLRDRVGNATGISRERLSAYLAELHINPHSELGGAIEAPVAARYFVIHDTSYPNCSEARVQRSWCPVPGALPANRDQRDWADAVGYFGHPRPYPDRIGNVITNRIGGSTTEVIFHEEDLPLTSTKFERCVDAAAKVRLFIAVENLQPRVGVPPLPLRGRPNDPTAPIPGFTSSQYERLALVYVAASVRQGSWMIPALHAVIDSYYEDGHDDPQNFDTQAFSEAVRQHVERLTG